MAVFVSGSNSALFLALNDASRRVPAFLWALLSVSGSLLGAIALLAPTLKTRPQWFAAALLAAPLAIAFSEGSKRYFDLLRPAGILEADSFQLIGQKLYVHAFPSGHSITAFLVAAVIVLAWPQTQTRRRAGALALLLASLIAFSRIAVGAHWPLDVLVGASAGWLLGALGVALMQRLHFIYGASGKRLMASLAITAGLVMLFVDLGYPEVRLYRISLAAWGIGGAAAALMDRGE